MSKYKFEEARRYSPKCIAYISGTYCVWCMCMCAMYKTHNISARRLRAHTSAAAAAAAADTQPQKGVAFRDRVEGCACVCVLYVPRVCCICADHFSASRARFYSFTTYTARARVYVRYTDRVMCADASSYSFSGAPVHGIRGDFAHICTRARARTTATQKPRIVHI